MIMEQWWNVADRGEAEVLGENMGQCHCVQVERPAGRMTGRQLTGRQLTARQMTGRQLTAPDDICDLSLISKMSL